MRPVPPSNGDPMRELEPPPAWVPPGLPASLAQAQDDLDQTIAGTMPSLAPAWNRRTRALSPEGDRTAYFLHPEAFPTLLLPAWLAGTDAEDDLLDAILRASLAGYWAIRLADQILDDASPEDCALVPVLALLHEQMWAPYREWFPAHDGFWSVAPRWWHGAADAAVAEAGQTDLDTLWALSAQKTAAAAIPLLAVHKRCGGATLPADADVLPPAWTALRQDLSRFHQLHNDFTDWPRDRAAHRNNGVQRWADLEAGGKDTTYWWAEQGALTFATNHLFPVLSRLQTGFQRLPAPQALAWCQDRHAQLTATTHQLRSSRDALRRLFPPSA